MNKKQQDQAAVTLATGLIIFVCVCIPIMGIIGAAVWYFGG